MLKICFDSNLRKRQQELGADGYHATINLQYNKTYHPDWLVIFRQDGRKGQWLRVLNKEDKTMH
jgi:hypothetical protein